MVVMEHALASVGAPELSLDAFDYELPADRIAQQPAARRDDARLMLLHRQTGHVAHRGVRDLPSLLRAGDVLVLNDTRVRPARLHGRVGTGGRVELLFVREMPGQGWQCIGRPARRLRVGAVVTVAGGVELVVRAKVDEGRYLVTGGAPIDIMQLLRAHGEVPLPPYISRGAGILPSDRERYQTVFARSEGAIAAPTAGLHFTPELLASVEARGVSLAWLTLHVGPGTFLPVRVDDVRDHQMEPEVAWIPATTAALVNEARRTGRRVVAVGTTTVRALESAVEDGEVRAGGRAANAFIVPGVRFHVIDALLTNFHLPRSTLLMLVCAFASSDHVLAAYAEAVRSGYRFYSYGDAMLIAQ